jgi:hypothetical protein
LRVKITMTKFSYLDGLGDEFARRTVAHGTPHWIEAYKKYVLTRPAAADKDRTGNYGQ